MARAVPGIDDDAGPGPHHGPAGEGGPGAVHDTMATLTGAGGGLALVTCSLLPWPAEGAGSTVAAHRFAEILLADVAAAWVPRWLGLVVYLVPAGGALVMVTSGLAGRIPAALKVCGLVPAAAVTLVTVAMLHERSSLDFGPGAIVALLGLLLALLSVVLDRRAGGGRPATPSSRAGVEHRREPHFDGRQDPANSEEDPCSA